LRRSLPFHLLLSAGALCAAFVAGPFCLEAAAQAPPPILAPDPKPSSQRVAADPQGQYLLIKKVVLQALAAPSRAPLPDESDGYDIARYCWMPFHVMGDWATKAALTGGLLVLALEAEQWKRDLERGGYPLKPLTEAIGRYEAGMIAAGASAEARAHSLKIFGSELETIRRTSPGAIRTRMFGGCGGPGPAVQLRFKTIPDGGKPRFIAKPLYDFCRAQEIEADDPDRCDYWMESSDTEPRFFLGEVVWFARWPDGPVARGEFDADKHDHGIVTLRQGAKK
jgi:hypothetical protein